MCRYPLHLAALNDKLDCLEVLLKAGVDKNLKNIRSVTAQQLATEKGHLDCTQAILNSGW
jgi:ankyrin repeat protein